MRFAPTDAQDRARRAAAAAVAACGGLTATRDRKTRGDPMDRDSYAALARAGLIHQCLDGLNAEYVAVAEELGSHLFWTPLFESVAAGELLRGSRSDEDRRRYEALRDGRMICVFTRVTTEDAVEAWPAQGGRLRVSPASIWSPWVPGASHVVMPLRTAPGTIPGPLRVAMAPIERFAVVANDAFLAAVPAGQASLGPGAHLDEADLIHADPAGAEARVSRARARLYSAMAAFCLGAAKRALSMGVEYSHVRRQFGRPIGAFQAQQHRLADVYMDLTLAERFVYAAPLVGDAVAPFYAGLAFRHASGAFVRSATAVSLVFGARGFTTQNDVHLFYLRSKIIQVLYGSAISARLTRDVTAEPVDGLPDWQAD